MIVGHIEGGSMATPASSGPANPFNRDSADRLSFALDPLRGFNLRGAVLGRWQSLHRIVAAWRHRQHDLDPESRRFLPSL